CVFVLLFGLVAFAQERASPYEFDMKKDLAAMGVAGGLAAVPLFLHVKHSCPSTPSTTSSSTPICSASNVNGFDRGIAGRSNDAIDVVSYGAAAAAVGWPFAAMYLDAPNGALTDGLVTGQAVLMNLAVNQWVKYGVHRTRPFVYNLPVNDKTRDKDGSYYSFYSQHTSLAFAAGISYARTYALRHPARGRRWLVYTAAIGGGAAVGSMRVLAGRHFPTDVMTGAAAGTSMGVLIPWLHQKRPATGLIVLPAPSGASVSLR